MNPWNLPMVNGQIDKFWPFDHRNSSILVMVMVKKDQFWPFDHSNFEILAMVMVKNYWPFDHDTRTQAKWSKIYGHLTPPPPWFNLYCQLSDLKMSIIALRCFPLYYLKINRRYLHYCFDREWTNEYEDPNRPSVGQDPNLLAMHMDQFDVTDADLQPSTSATEINEVSDAHPTLGEEYPSEFQGIRS